MANSVSNILQKLNPFRRFSRFTQRRDLEDQLNPENEDSMPQRESQTTPMMSRLMGSKDSAEYIVENSNEHTSSSGIQMENEMTPTPMANNGNNSIRDQLLNENQDNSGGSSLTDTQPTNQGPVNNGNATLNDEGITRKKKYLNKIVAPITCLCGATVVGGIGINVTLEGKKHKSLLWIVTLVLCLDTFIFIIIWVSVNKISKSLTWIIILEAFFYLTVLLFCGALATGVVGVR